VSGFPNHVFAYRGVLEGIVIVRVFHAAQDWQHLLEGDIE
jgi:plasmid stabilization system protein ParE